MRVQPDAISIFFDVAAATVLAFYIFAGGALFAPAVGSVVLLSLGIGLDRYSTKRTDEDEPETVEDTGGQGFKIIIYGLSSVAVFYAMSFFASAIPPSFLQSLSAAAPLSIVSLNGLFIIQEAVSESEFFHRLLTNVFASRLGPFGFPAVGAVGMAFHLFVYGDSTTGLIVVFGAFTTLAFIAWYTGRVSPVIIGHVLDNGIASGLFSFSLPVGHFVLGANDLATGVFSLGLLGLVLVVKRR